MIDEEHGSTFTVLSHCTRAGSKVHRLLLYKEPVEERLVCASDLRCRPGGQLPVPTADCSKDWAFSTIISCILTGTEPLGKQYLKL